MSLCVLLSGFEPFSCEGGRISKLCRTFSLVPSDTIHDTLLGVLSNAFVNLQDVR